jgi:hypothetical protein
MKTVLNITKDQLDRVPPDRLGPSYGALVVPYKYHFNGSKEFSGNSTIGSYLGLRIGKESLGFAFQPIGFVGAAVIPVTQSGTNSTQTFAGFTYGGGFLFDIKDAFHAGIVLGFDQVSPSANYKDNGKPWIAIEIGYAFSQ